MKKILYFSLMFVMLFTMVGITKDVKADSLDTITWSIDGTFPEEAVVGTVIFGSNATEVQITIPSSPYWINDNGVQLYKFKFYNSADVLTDSFEVPDIFGDNIGAAGTYDLNFDILSIDSTAIYVELILPISVWADEDVADELLISMAANSSVVVLRDEIPSNAFRFSWNDDYDSSGISSISSAKVPFDSTAEYLSIFTLYVSLFVVSDYRGDISFYDDTDTLLGTVYPWTYFVRDTSNPRQFDIPVSELSYYDDIDTFQVNGYLYDFYPTNIHSANVGVFFSYDDDTLIQANFYNGTTLFQSFLRPLGYIVGSISSIPSSSDSTKEFAYWVDGYGVRYNFTPITIDQVINGTVNFYAVFQDIPSPLFDDITDPTADDDGGFTVLMESLGFNDPVERTIVFAIVATITVALLLVFKVPHLVTIVAVAGELAFFIYLGLLPIFVGIIVGIVLILLVVLFGGRSNE